MQLLGTSAWYAPGAAAAQMVDSVLLDQKRILPCTAYLEGEYGIDGLYMGVPVKLGAGGIEEILELDLTDEEQQAFQRSADAVREVVAVLTGNRQIATARPGRGRATIAGCAPPRGASRAAGRRSSPGSRSPHPLGDYLFLPGKAQPAAPLVRPQRAARGRRGGIYMVDIRMGEPTPRAVFPSIPKGDDLPSAR